MLDKMDDNQQKKPAAFQEPFPALDEGALAPVRGGAGEGTVNSNPGDVQGVAPNTPVAPTPIRPTPIRPTPIRPTPIWPTPIWPTPIWPTPIRVFPLMRPHPVTGNPTIAIPRVPPRG
jgi:hypothetical protein